MLDILNFQFYRLSVRRNVFNLGECFQRVKQLVIMKACLIFFASLTISLFYPYKSVFLHANSSISISVRQSFNLQSQFYNDIIIRYHSDNINHQFISHVKQSIRPVLTSFPFGEKRARNFRSCYSMYMLSSFHLNIIKLNQLIFYS